MAGEQSRSGALAPLRLTLNVGNLEFLAWLPSNHRNEFEQKCSYQMAWYSLTGSRMSLTSESHIGVLLSESHIWSPTVEVLPLLSTERHADSLPVHINANTITRSLNRDYHRCDRSLGEERVLLVGWKDAISSPLSRRRMATENGR